jgi:hypothetical protein
MSTPLVETRGMRWRQLLSRMLDRLASKWGRVFLSATIWAVIGFLIWLLLKLFSWQGTGDFLVRFCKWIGINPVDRQAEFLIDALAHHSSELISLVLGFLIVRLALRPTTLITLLRRRLIPINLALADNEEDMKFFEKYFYRGAAARICGILPDELQPMWEEKTLRNCRTLKHSQLLRPRCIQERDAESKALPKNIPDIWMYLDDYLLDASHYVPPLMIHGEPGSGKSVLLYHYFGERSLQLIALKCGWIPLFIFAHQLTEELLDEGETLKSFLKNYFRDAHNQNPNLGYGEIAELIDQRFNEKQFLIIIDGLDELPERDGYVRVIDKLNNLITKHEEARDKKKQRPDRFIVSCRTEDNPDSMKGSLVRIQPLEFTQSIAYLKGLVTFFRKTGNAEPERRVRNALNGLKRSNEQGFLRNYVNNPFLLSLISKYYEKSKDTTGWLNQIFKEVLKRELEKAYNQRVAKALEKGIPVPKKLGDNEFDSLADRVEEIIGPFCFERSFNPNRDSDPNRLDANGKVQADLFEETLQKGLGVGVHLFGTGNSQGALLRCYNDRDTKSEIDYYDDLVKAATGLEGEDSKWFLNKLQHLKQNLDVKQFQHEACELLRQRSLSWLKDASLAEVSCNQRGQIISLIRLRHRRLGEYFAAKCMNKYPIGLERIKQHLQSAWIREPLRIFAAVAENPIPLLDACVKRYQELNKIGDTRRAVDVLQNAAAVIEYLPRSRQSQNASEDNLQYNLQQAILRVGEEAMNYSEVCAVNANHGKELSECIIVVKAVFAAEYWMGVRNEEKQSFFRSFQTGLKLSNWAQEMVRLVAVRSSLDQLVVYRQLWPIKTTFLGLGISRFKLFALIVHASPFFWESYNYTVKNAHPYGLNRLFIFLGCLLTRILSIILIILGGFLLFEQSPSPLPYFRWGIIGAYIIALLAFAVIAQRKTWMDIQHGYKLILWSIVCGFKKMWAHFINHKRNTYLPKRPMPVVPVAPISTTATFRRLVSRSIPPSVAPSVPPSVARPFASPGQAIRAFLNIVFSVLLECLTGVYGYFKSRMRVKHFLVIVFAVLFSSLVWWWGIPAAKQWSARHAILRVQNEAAKANQEHRILMAWFQTVKTNSSVEDLRALLQKHGSDAKLVNELSKRVSEVYAVGESLGLSDELNKNPVSSILKSLDTQANDEQVAAAEAEGRVFELLNIQSAVSSLKKLQNECVKLAEEGENLIQNDEILPNDTQVSQRLTDFHKWDTKEKEIEQEFANLGPVPINVPQSCQRGATSALNKLVNTEKEISRLIGKYGTQLALSLQQSQIQTSLDAVKALTLTGNQLAMTLSQNQSQDLTSLSQQDNAADEWLNSTRSARTQLKKCNTNLQPPQITEAVSLTVKENIETETKVVNEQMALKQIIQKIRLQSDLREVSDQGSNLVARSISGMNVADLTSLQKGISQWLKRAKAIGSQETTDLSSLAQQLEAKQQQIIQSLTTAELERARKQREEEETAYIMKGQGFLTNSVFGMRRADLTSLQSNIGQWLSDANGLVSPIIAITNNSKEDKDLSKLIQQLQTKQQQITQAINAVDAQQREATITDLLDGPEWKNLDTALKPYRSPGEDAQRLAIISSALLYSNLSFETVTNSLDFLAKLTDRKAKIGTIQSELTDYNRRVGELIVSAAPADTHGLERLRSRQEDTKRSLKDLATFGNSQAAATDDLKTKLNGILHGLEQKKATADQKRSDRIAFFVVFLVVLLSFVCVFYFFGSFRWSRRLRDVPNTMDDLEAFLCKEKGIPLRVARETVTRMQTVARQELEAAQNGEERKQKTRAYCTHFEEIKTKAFGNSLGYNAQEINRLLDQTINGLNNERNR